MTRTLKQRLVMSRRPKQLPIGSVREWQAGTFVKVGRNRWRRQLRAIAAIPDDVAQERGGVVGALKAVQTATGKQREALARYVITEMSTWDVRNPPKLLELPAAIASLLTDVHGPSLPWWLYCARRIAAFNDGKVDLGTIDKYVERARRFHEEMMPDMHKAIGYTGPRTVADINLASWQQFFLEGGQLNQPYWLETNRLKELRHQFEFLANLHGGRSDR